MDSDNIAGMIVSPEIHRMSLNNTVFLKSRFHKVCLVPFSNLFHSQITGLNFDPHYIFICSWDEDNSFSNTTHFIYNNKRQTVSKNVNPECELWAASKLFWLIII